MEIGSVTTWAERMQSAGGFVRQPTYWRGEMMGSHVGHRPGSFPDVIVDESLVRQAVWKHPHAVPQRCYDYGKTWSYTAFEPTGTAPASEPFAGIEVKTKIHDWRLWLKLVGLDLYRLKTSSLKWSLTASSSP
ncbi:MAG: hypothetical protein EBY32_02690 [Proteobacteria bacterium]|nr:hypothetical protein [Pseudomonadota bacterium]